MMYPDTETHVTTGMDFVFEFDAPWFFDFSREESSSEVHDAELWFQTARSDPPSPFATKLILRDVLANANIFSRSKDDENMDIINDAECNSGPSQVASVMDISNRGPVNHESTINNPKAWSVKQPVLKSSTLMKPTASHLAKKVASCASGDSRLHAMHIHGTPISLNNSCIIENQASKRQKLEGGRLRKVADVRQQTTFVHKALNKEKIGSSLCAKPRITIPIEPELETLQRAHRVKTSTKQEHEISIFRKFKARPLNRKIFETPTTPIPKKSTPCLPKFQEFHLKTSERALQHSSASSSSHPHNKFDKVLHKHGNNSIIDKDGKNTKRSTYMDALKQERCESLKFKAYPPNAKSFTNVGEIGVLQNSKHTTRVAKNINSHTEKQIPHEPPIELFTKLSLTSDLQPDARSQIKLPQPTHVAMKVQKENRLNSVQQKLEMPGSMKEKMVSFWR